MKPFDQPHPIRGSFGDPRTLFRAPPTVHGMLRGDGSFAFHFGVDIATPDGTKVYPVLSGVVSKVTREWVAVDVGNGRVFQYWHIVAAVREGDARNAGKTVLGKTKDGFQPPPLLRAPGRPAVSPLRRGGLSPYTDTTVPTSKEITLRRQSDGRDLVPNLVRGKVQFVAEAYDRPELAIPAAVEQHACLPREDRLADPAHDRPSRRPDEVARDVRVTIPRREHFWDYYARGTFQNMSVFAKHYSYGEPGLLPVQARQGRVRHADSLRDGVYDLVVTASDIAGNSSTTSLRFTVENEPEVRS